LKKDHAMIEGAISPLESDILDGLARIARRLGNDEDCDRGLAVEILRSVAPLYGDLDTAALLLRVEAFVGAEQEKLRRVYENYRCDNYEMGRQLVRMPVSLMVFHRIQIDPFRLIERWKKLWESDDILEQLFAAWGCSLY
jgi:hypothetical protein